MNEQALQAAIALAQAAEIGWPRDPLDDPERWGVHQADPPPWNRLRGPVHPRGPQSGVIWQHGQEIAAWGEPERADLSFSVAKTYLCLLAGIAQREGLLPDLQAPVAERLPGIGFDSPHNRPIRWAQLLEQTSEWEGVCFGLPDQVDRWRKVANDPRPAGGPKGGARALQTPGTYWEYNDVRINQLALALLQLFQRPLPEVFLGEILQPLGGGAGFAWRGYDDAWLTLADGRRVQSVPGGTHWGGGVSISSRDQARVGQLLLQQGRHQGRDILPPGWVAGMTQPCAIAPFYGRLVWLNRDGRAFAGASPRAFFMMGAGGHVVWMEPALAAVVVLRWLDTAQLPALLRGISAALQG